MLSGEQRYYSGLLSAMTVVGGGVLFSFTYLGNMTQWVGWSLTACLLGVGVCLLFILIREKIRDWQISSAGSKVKGQIRAIEKNSLLGGPAIVRYAYAVAGKEYEGSAWTTIHFLHQVPAEGSACLVSYDKENPQHSLLEDWLKPYYS